MAAANSGSFAPPLTDELLDEYEALVTELSSQKDWPVGSGTAEIVKYLKLLLNCCRKWWELPESSQEGSRPHPCGTGIHNPLDTPYVHALALCMPTASELQLMGNLFDLIDKDTVASNGKKIAAWQRSVQKHAQVKRDSTRRKKWLGLKYAESDKEFEGRRQTAFQEAREALQFRTHAEIPYPELTPTPLRNCAFHLLWHANELALGREPMTLDKMTS